MFLESVIKGLEKGKAKLVNDVMTSTVITPRLNLDQNDSTFATIKLCYQMSKITSDLKLHASSTPN